MPFYIALLSIFLLLSGCGSSNSTLSSSEPERVDKVVARVANGGCLAPEGMASTATTLSATGCFSDTATQAMAAGVLPYTVNSLLWSDGESKGRYFAIPDGTTISIVVDEPSISALRNGIKNGDLDFPEGSVVIKHFYSGSRIIETRLLMNHTNDGWVGYAYEWNEAQTEGTLLAASKQITTPVNHYFPSRQECMDCHTDAVKVVLGPDTLQLNYTLYYTDNTEENYLDALARLGYLSQALQSFYKTKRLYAIDDSSATLEQRARSYLHSNCSGCHRVGAPQGGYGDMRYNASFATAAKNVCDVDAMLQNSPAGGKLVDPGSSSNSTIHQRLSSTGSIKMPPIGRERVDPDAMHVISRWINNLSSCDESAL